MKKEKNKSLHSIVSIVIITSLFVLQTSNISAIDEKLRTHIEVAYASKCIITNAEGEILNYDHGDSSGTMDVFSDGPGSSYQTRVFDVYSSELFKYKNLSQEKSVFNANGTIVKSNYADSISIYYENGVERALINGNKGSFNIDLYARESGLEAVEIKGSGTGDIDVSDTKDGVVVSGAKGVVSIETNDLEDNKDSIQNFEVASLGGDIRISKSGDDKIKITGAVKLLTKYYKRALWVHVRKMSNPEKLLLYWGKVKNAKGYIVYRYDSADKKYKKAAVINGRENRVWTDSKVDLDTLYRYKVAAYSTDKKNKNPKEGTLSYNVSGIAGYGEKENATRVLLNKNAVRAKAGRKVFLEATVITTPDKLLLNKNVRWHSTNKRVAMVNWKGQVSLKKKGTAYIFAKSHNGMNSKHIEIVVK